MASLAIFLSPLLLLATSAVDKPVADGVVVNSQVHTQQDAPARLTEEAAR